MRLTRLILQIVSCVALLAPQDALGQDRVTAKTETARGLYKTTYETPRGTITVNLPDDMTAGDVISGTVIAEPAGRTESEQRKNTDELSGYVVELEQAKTSVGKQVLKWAVPSAVTAAGSFLILRDRRGEEIARTPVPVETVPPAVARPATPSPDDFDIPRIGPAGKAVPLLGNFDGDFSTTAVKIGGRDTRILAESPRQAVVETPRDVVGPTDMVVKEGDVEARGEYRNIQVRLTAPKTLLRRGEQTTLHTELTGLEGLDEEIQLRQTNRTPDVVSVEGGEVQVVTIRPEELQPAGTYAFDRVVTGIRPGAYTISAVGSWDSFGPHAEHGDITKQGLKGTCLGKISARIAECCTDVDKEHGWFDPSAYTPDAHFDRDPKRYKLNESWKAFEDGKKYVAAKKEELLKTLTEAQAEYDKENRHRGRKRLERAERTLGQLLHARQDAYAHTNYVQLAPGLQQEFADFLDCKNKSVSPALSQDLKVTSYDADLPGKLPYTPPGDPYPHDDPRDPKDGGTGGAIGHHKDKHPQEYAKAKDAATKDTKRAVEDIRKELEARFEELYPGLGKAKADELWGKFGKKKSR